MTPDEIRNTILKAIYSDTELVKNLVLKGGNALKLHRIVDRESQDLDFSIKETIRFTKEYEGVKLQQLITDAFRQKGLLDSKSSVSLPFAIDSFIKNETDEKVLKKMFFAINTKFLSLKSQTFFSVIKDNLKYIDSKVSQVIIESPLLKSECYAKLSKEVI